LPLDFRVSLANAGKMPALLEAGAAVSGRHEAQFHLAAEGGGGFAEAGDGERGVGGIEQPIQRGPAGFHAGGQFGFGDAVLHEDLLELEGNDPFEGEHLDFGKNAFRGKEIPEVAAAVGVLWGFGFHVVTWLPLPDRFISGIRAEENDTQRSRGGLGHGRTVSKMMLGSSGGFEVF
jgi:hypothetical protein